MGKRQRFQIQRMARSLSLSAVPKGNRTKINDVGQSPLDFKVNHDLSLEKTIDEFKDVESPSERASCGGENSDDILDLTCERPGDFENGPSTPPPSRSSVRRKTIGYFASPQAPLRGRHNTQAYLAAIRRQNCDEIHRLAEAGVDVNTPVRALARRDDVGVESLNGEEEYVLPLLVASAEASPRVIKSILDAGASVNSVNRKDQNALHVLSFSPGRKKTVLSTPLPSTNVMPRFAMTPTSSAFETPKKIFPSPLRCSLGSDAEVSPAPVESRKKRRRLSADGDATSSSVEFSVDDFSKCSSQQICAEKTSATSNRFHPRGSTGDISVCLSPPRRDLPVTLITSAEALDRDEGSRTPPHLPLQESVALFSPSNNSLSPDADIRRSAEILVSHGIDFEHRDSVGKMPVDYAIENCNFEILDVVKNAQRSTNESAERAELNLKKRPTGRTTLQPPRLLPSAACDPRREECIPRRRKRRPSRLCF